MLTHAYNPSIWRTEAGGLSGFPAWPKSETLSLKKTINLCWERLRSVKFLCRPNWIVAAVRPCTRHANQVCFSALLPRSLWKFRKKAQVLCP